MDNGWRLAGRAAVGFKVLGLQPKGEGEMSKTDAGELLAGRAITWRSFHQSFPPIAGRMPVPSQFLCTGCFLIRLRPETYPR
jgi:hypothetical protein